MGRLFYLGFTRGTLNKTSLHMEEDKRRRRRRRHKAKERRARGGEDEHSRAVFVGGRKSLSLILSFCRRPQNLLPRVLYI